MREIFRWRIQIVIFYVIFFCQQCLEEVGLQMEGTGRWRQARKAEGVWFQILLELNGNLCISRTAPPLPAYVSEPTYPLPRGRREGVVFSGAHHMVPLLSACADLSRSLGQSENHAKELHNCVPQTQRGKNMVFIMHAYRLDVKLCYLLAFF